MVIINSDSDAPNLYDVETNEGYVRIRATSRINAIHIARDIGYYVLSVHPVE